MSRLTVNHPKLLRRLRNVRCARWWSVLLTLCSLVCLPAPAWAQTALLTAPAGFVLPSVTPLFSARATGFGPGRPLRFQFTASTSPDFVGGVVFDSTIVSNDSVIPIQVVRPLPSEAMLYFKLRVTGVGTPLADAPIVGPRQVPSWLVLLSPETPQQLESRRPLFVWRSAPVLPLIGPWKYDLEVTTTGGGTKAATSGISDTTFRFDVDFESDASYRWSVRAYLPKGDAIKASSRSTFFILNPALPTATILYNNFPNPFPTASAFATCFWFDLAEPGGRVTLDILDLRGNLVRSLIPGVDGQRDFPPGKYGRGAAGTGTNCDGRFIWDATGSDGRSVAKGVYIARFRAAGGPTTFRNIYFKGR